MFDSDVYFREYDYFTENTDDVKEFAKKLMTENPTQVKGFMTKEEV